MEAEKNFLSPELQNSSCSKSQHKQTKSMASTSSEPSPPQNNKNTMQFTLQLLAVLVLIRQDIIKCLSGEAKNTEENMPSTILTSVGSGI